MKMRDRPGESTSQCTSHGQSTSQCTSHGQSTSQCTSHGQSTSQCTSWTQAVFLVKLFPVLAVHDFSCHEWQKRPWQWNDDGCSVTWPQMASSTATAAKEAINWGPRGMVKRAIKHSCNRAFMGASSFCCPAKQKHEPTMLFLRHSARLTIVGGQTVDRKGVSL